jgi:hypothetical protein
MCTQRLKDKIGIIDNTETIDDINTVDSIGTIDALGLSMHREHQWHR